MPDIRRLPMNIPFNSSAIIITPSSYLSFQIQLVSLMDILLNNIGKTTPNNNIMPVSYTHLDVYKRQFLESALKSSGYCSAKRIF